MGSVEGLHIAQLVMKNAPAKFGEKGNGCYHGV